jgi:hypothetical protein
VYLGDIDQQTLICKIYSRRDAFPMTLPTYEPSTNFIND